MIYLVENGKKIEIGKVEGEVLPVKKAFEVGDSKGIVQCLLDFGSVIQDGGVITNQEKFYLFGNIDYFDMDGMEYKLEKSYNVKQDLYNRSGFLKESIYDIISKIKSIEELLACEKTVNKKEFSAEEVEQFVDDARKICENLLPVRYKNGEKSDVYFQGSRLFYDLKIIAENKGLNVPVSIIEEALLLEKSPKEIDILQTTIKNYERLILNQNGMTLLDYTDNEKMIGLLYKEEDE